MNVINTADKIQVIQQQLRERSVKYGVGVYVDIHF
jgi:hypothetical protein